MRHIYVHVPFCARRCTYCDFAIAIRKVIPGERYVHAIRGELDARRAAGDWNDEPLETLYFGGGTPSLLPATDIAELAALFGNTAGREVTLEANPDDVTLQSARGWVSAGVNRISLGAQSFQSQVLAWMHRTHDADATPRAISAARQAGVQSLSLDLIFGLPADAGSSFVTDLHAAIALEPQHLSVYGLSVEERTPLARWISRGATRPPSGDRYAEEFWLAHETLTAAGYEHYEVSNYARPGHHSRHNSAYWIDRDYLGLGPAAHSYVGGIRRWNLRDWARYERAVIAGADPVEASEVLDAGQRQLERLYLGLRTVAGVPRGEWWAFPGGAEALWTARGWLETTGSHVRLTPAGWLYLDEIVPSLTTLPDGG